MSDYGDMCKDLREMRREIAEQARLLGIGGTRESALMAKVDAITRERDRARAEVERMRSTLIDVVNQIRKCDPVDELGHRMTMNRACLEAETLLDSAATEAARKFCGVGELERAGYIPAGSADEREAKP